MDVILNKMSLFAITTSWSNINGWSVGITKPGVYMINATFAIDYLTNVGTQGLF